MSTLENSIPLDGLTPEQVQAAWAFVTALRDENFVDAGGLVELDGEDLDDEADTMTPEEATAEMLAIPGFDERFEQGMADVRAGRGVRLEDVEWK